MRHIHLDPLGGMAGDMFIAAMLDAFPDLAADTVAAAQSLAPVGCALLPHTDHILAGSRFQVTEHHAHEHHGHEHHGHEHHAHEHHGHTHWSRIKAMIQGAALTDTVKAHALGIFGVLAQAEGKVHGIPPDHVAFHEVGAADSIADIVAASWLIDAIGPASWSVGPVPLGAGMVQTAHGRLPVPAPATSILLAGLAVADDGIPGERVTPTGAAILRHLGCGAKPGGLVMGATGIGFGSRVLPGISNCLRVLVFDVTQDRHAPAAAVPHRNLLVVNFEVDDQSPEDLASGDRAAACRAWRARRADHARFRQERADDHARPASRRHRSGGSGGGCVLRANHHHRPAHADGVRPRAAPPDCPDGHAGRRGPGETGGTPGRADRKGGTGRSCFRRDPRRPRAPAPAGGGWCMLKRLEGILRDIGPMAVAVSGGIDSLTLATAAHRAVPGVTMHHASSPAVPAEATARTRAQAHVSGWTLDVFDAGEFERAAYRSNPVNRCFHCKTSLYGAIARRTALPIVSGTNTDDLGEYRPGLDAARDHAVRHPFVEAGIDKAGIRRLAIALGLGALSALPSAPCLSSRIETGIVIQPPVLGMVHKAEQLVAAALRPHTVRCRVRRAGVVVELDAEALARLLPGQAEELARQIARLGMAAPVSFAAYVTGSAFVQPAA